jgi:hypothetical protein
VIDRVTVYRTDYGHGPGASLELPAPRAGWVALTLQNPDGSAGPSGWTGRRRRFPR